MKRLISLVIACTILSCDALDPLNSAPEAHRGARGIGAGADQLRVLTRNVYVGTDVDAVLAASSPEEIPVLAAQAYQTLLATNFPERAASLAREIALTRPHLIGLQEISTIRIQSPGDAVVGGTVPAQDVTFDFLAILLDALETAGQSYRVAAIVQNTDVEVPMLASVSPLSFDDVRLTDFDVILARRGVETWDEAAANFAARFSVPIGPVSIDILRGYTAVTARIGRQQARFVNTHLEPGANPLLTQVRVAQAGELLQTLTGVTDPVVLVGDLNSLAPAGEAYQTLLAAGFQDAWVESRFGDSPGFTCCHVPELNNAEADFDHRIDLILGRGNEYRPRLRVGRATIVGDEQRNRTASGLWPSDHGGVFAAIGFRGRRTADRD